MLWFRAPQKVYIKKGCLPVALDELKTVMNKKKAFIVTDTFTPTFSETELPPQLPQPRVNEGASLKLYKSPMPPCDEGRSRND